MRLFGFLILVLHRAKSFNHASHEGTPLRLGCSVLDFIFVRKGRHELLRSVTHLFEILLKPRKHSRSLRNGPLVEKIIQLLTCVP